MRVRFRLVDVFTEAPFAGNQLCVVADPPAELDTPTMQMLAKEIGFSETTFVTEAAGDHYAMRIFTPNRSCRSPATRPSGPPTRWLTTG
jgi:trans-2,3-dihydro-3-hydroxyanthranilate isomerase